MARPEGLVFGHSPRKWATVGFCCSLLCALFATAFYLGPALDPEFDYGVVNWAGCVFGSCCSAICLWVVFVRHEFVIILAEQAVHVGPDYRRTVAYRNIKTMRCGADGEVWCNQENPNRWFKIPDYFGSPEERNRFVEELNRRVEQAKSAASN